MVSTIEGMAPKRKPKKGKLKGYLVRFTTEEDKTLTSRAAVEELSMAGLLRKGVGLEPMEHGGVRKGAGRPPKKGA